MFQFESLEATSFDEAPTRVYLNGEFLNGDLLLISAEIENAQVPVLGTSFHLKYDENKLKFLRYEPGGFLEQGGDPFYLAKDIENEGKVIFGQTLRNDDRFPVGEGDLVQFTFQIEEEGIFAFEFDREVVSSLDEVRQDIDDVIFEDFSIERGSDKESVFASKLDINTGEKGFSFNFDGKNKIVISIR